MRPSFSGDIASIAVCCGLLMGGAAADLPPVPLEAAGTSCDSECDLCLCGTEYENNCPAEWLSDDKCDCGCQFCDAGCSCDIQDCISLPTEGACCCPDLSCTPDMTQLDCLALGCIYRGHGSSCASGCPCDDLPEPCDWCWIGTYAHNSCDSAWYGAGNGCDCGCQWFDPDCGSPPAGACCGPSQTTPECVEPVVQQACLDAAGAYMGDDVTCASVNGCVDRCDSECAWCWTGTPVENDCGPAWDGDGECDCGCQFCDTDCPSCQAPTGACCDPYQEVPACLEGVEEPACLDLGMVYVGDGVTCASINECADRCTSGCVWCWCGAAEQNNCPLDWYYDGECDCGCQFCDPDCPDCAMQLCCSIAGDLTGDGVINLDDYGLLPDCLLGPGGAVPNLCTCTDFDADGDVDMQDVAEFQIAFEGS